MNDKYFLDTNIIVYSFSDESPAKKAAASDLIKTAIETQKGVISFQVIQEFLNVATRKFKSPLKANDADRYLKLALDPICKVYSSMELYSQALDIMERWQYSFYDSLIIAAALKAECKILYTEDLRHEQKIYSMQIINPFYTNI